MGHLNRWFSIDRHSGCLAVLFLYFLCSYILRTRLRRLYSILLSFIVPVFLSYEVFIITHSVKTSHAIGIGKATSIRASSLTLGFSRLSLQNIQFSFFNLETLLRGSGGKMTKWFLISLKYSRKIRLSFRRSLLALRPLFALIVEFDVFLRKREGRIFSIFSLREYYPSFQNIRLSIRRRRSPWLSRLAHSMKGRIKNRELKPSCTSSGSLLHIQIAS